MQTIFLSVLSFFLFMLSLKQQKHKIWTFSPLTADYKCFLSGKLYLYLTYCTSVLTEMIVTDATQKLCGTQHLHKEALFKVQRDIFCIITFISTSTMCLCRKVAELVFN